MIGVQRTESARGEQSLAAGLHFSHQRSVFVRPQRSAFVRRRCYDRTDRMMIAQPKSAEEFWLVQLAGLKQVSNEHQ